MNNSVKDSRIESSIVNNKYQFKDHKATLGTFLDFCKWNAVIITNSYNYWMDSDYAVCLAGEHHFGKTLARKLILEFDGSRKDSKLMKIKCEYLNDLGLWVDGVIYKRPWHKGGAWL